ncbi:MAG: glycosyltransferase [Betaproteobacteria bacterium]
MDRTNQPAVLMIAFHFPPLRGSSGIQRTLGFCRYLPEFGWNPIVLTVNPQAYEDVADDSLADVPPGLLVQRAFALNTARHLAIGGRYPRLLAIPDRWISWLAGGVISGLALIRKHRIRALYSTYPIATAHLIGIVLQRITGLPWIADFRDPMAQEGYPEDPAVWKSFRWIEEQALRHARYSLFTSPGALRDYRARYPGIPADRLELVENGYDEDAFTGPGVAASAARGSASVDRLVILHSGIVYTSERDPTQLFRALAELKRGGFIDARGVEFRFRASANDALLHALAEEHAIADLISVVPAIPYRAALSEMMGADALLVMQAANCNSQIPAKTYEYLRAGRPIFALTDPNGDTADLMRRAGVAPIIPLDSMEGIASALPGFLAALRSRTARAANPEFVAGCSRREVTRALAGLLAKLP